MGGPGIGVYQCRHYGVICINFARNILKADRPVIVTPMNLENLAKDLSDFIEAAARTLSVGTRPIPRHCGLNNGRPG
jgi:hypothetical protein